MVFDIIAAVHISNNAIGKNGTLPWKNSVDMKYFRELTTTTSSPDKINAVIMGRKTYDSIGMPLKNRINVILSRTQQPENSQQPIYQSNLDDALHLLGKNPTVENIFVIGGESIYKTALDHPSSRNIYLNIISTKCDVDDADAFFPTIDQAKYKQLSEKILASDVLNRVYEKIQK